MGTDNNFIATGRAAAGFRTSNEHPIAIGVDVRGDEIGVRGKGGATGVMAVGTFTGVRGEGRQVGVEGRCTGKGPGGEFHSTEVCAQLKLQPNAYEHASNATRNAAPYEFQDPGQGLPHEGRRGDVLALLTEAGDPLPDSDRPDDAQPHCHLWLCVRDDRPGHSGAMWAQLLLGAPHEGHRRT